MTNGVHHWWEHWEAVAAMSTIASLLVHNLWRLFNLKRRIDADHERLNALWREHGYGAWNGSERRRI